MTDRELLELAAKAAGYTLEDHFDSQGLYWPWCNELSENWCPLTDDGDALRLAVKLQIDISVADGDVIAWDRTNPSCIELWDEDPYAATRRSIVRAAAEIGKGMA